MGAYFLAFAKRKHRYFSPLTVISRAPSCAHQGKSQKKPFFYCK